MPPRLHALCEVQRKRSNELSLVLLLWCSLPIFQIRTSLSLFLFFLFFLSAARRYGYLFIHPYWKIIRSPPHNCTVPFALTLLFLLFFLLARTPDQATKYLFNTSSHPPTLPKSLSRFLFSLLFHFYVSIDVFCISPFFLIYFCSRAHTISVSSRFPSVFVPPSFSPTLCVIYFPLSSFSSSFLCTDCFWVVPSPLSPTPFQLFAHLPSIQTYTHSRASFFFFVNLLAFESSFCFCSRFPIRLCFAFSTPYLITHLFLFYLVIAIVSSARYLSFAFCRFLFLFHFLCRFVLISFPSSPWPGSLYSHFPPFALVFIFLILSLFATHLHPFSELHLPLCHFSFISLVYLSSPSSSIHSILLFSIPPHFPTSPFWSVSHPVFFLFISLLPLFPFNVLDLANPTCSGGFCLLASLLDFSPRGTSFLTFPRIILFLFHSLSLLYFSISVSLFPFHSAFYYSA